MARSRVLSFMSTFGGPPRSPTNSSPQQQQQPPQASGTPPNQTPPNEPADGKPPLDATADPDRRESPAPLRRGRDRAASSRPASMIGGYQPPLMDTQDTIPELSPIFGFLNSHSNKLYQEGYFLKLNDLDIHGKPYADRSWTECFAQLVGTVLSLWDAAALDSAGQDGEVPPTFINLSDATIKMIPELPTRSKTAQPLQNVLSVSTAGRNRYLFHFSNINALTQWTAGIRLAMFENISLQEAYTGSLVGGKGRTLNNIKELQMPAKFATDGWARVRFGAGTAWKRYWCVITPPSEKEVKKAQQSLRKKAPGSVYDKTTTVFKGDVRFYDTNKLKKATLQATIRDAYAAYAIYPQSKPLIDSSTILKVEGVITIHTAPEQTLEGFIFVMPEVRPALTGFEMLLRFLFPIWDVFALYGRPARLAPDTADARSLMFAMPERRRYGYLELLDVANLIHESGSQHWSEREWRARLKQLTLECLRRQGQVTAAASRASPAASRANSRAGSRNGGTGSRSRQNSLPSRGPGGIRFRDEAMASTPALTPANEALEDPLAAHAAAAESGRDSAPPLSNDPYGAPPPLLNRQRSHQRSVSENTVHSSPRRLQKQYPGVAPEYTPSRLSSEQPRPGELGAGGHPQQQQAPPPPMHGVPAGVRRPPPTSQQAAAQRFPGEHDSGLANRSSSESERRYHDAADPQQQHGSASGGGATGGPSAAMQPHRPPSPVAAPPTFAHPPGAKPPTRPHHDHALRRAESRMSTATLSQLVAASGGSVAAANGIGAAAAAGAAGAAGGAAGGIAAAGAAAAWHRSRSRPRGGDDDDHGPEENARDATLPVGAATPRHAAADEHDADARFAGPGAAAVTASGGGAAPGAGGLEWEAQRQQHQQQLGTGLNAAAAAVASGTAVGRSGYHSAAAAGGRQPSPLRQPPQQYPPELEGEDYRTAAFSAHNNTRNRTPSPGSRRSMVSQHAGPGAVAAHDRSPHRSSPQRSPARPSTSTGPSPAASSARVNAVGAEARPPRPQSMIARKPVPSPGLGAAGRPSPMGTPGSEHAPLETPRGVHESPRASPGGFFDALATPRATAGFVAANTPPTAPAAAAAAALGPASPESEKSPESLHAAVDEAALSRVRTFRSADSTNDGASGTEDGDSHYESTTTASPDYDSPPASILGRTLPPAAPARPDPGTRAGVRRTVGTPAAAHDVVIGDVHYRTEDAAPAGSAGATGSGDGSGLDMPEIDFGPTLLYTPELRTGPSEAGAHARRPGSRDRLATPEPGVHSRSSSHERAAELADNAKRRSVAWQPGAATVGAGGGGGASGGSPGRGPGAITPEQFVAQRAAASRVVPTYAHTRHDSRTPPPLLGHSRTPSRTPPLVGGGRRTPSGDWSRPGSGAGVRPGSRGAAQALHGGSGGGGSGPATPDYARGLSAREQEQLARATGAPLLHLGGGLHNNSHGHSSNNSPHARTGSSGPYQGGGGGGSGGPGLVGAIEARENEKRAARESHQFGGGPAVQAALAQRQAALAHQQAVAQAQQAATAQQQQYHQQQQQAAGGWPTMMQPGQPSPMMGSMPGQFPTSPPAGYQYETTTPPLGQQPPGTQGYWGGIQQYVHGQSQSQGPGQGQQAAQGHPVYGHGPYAQQSQQQQGGGAGGYGSYGRP